MCEIVGTTSLARRCPRHGDRHEHLAPRSQKLLDAGVVEEIGSRLALSLVNIAKAEGATIPRGVDH
jgi:hypothetical protein